MPSIDSIIHVGTYTNNSVLAHDPKGAPSSHGIHSFRLNVADSKLEPLDKMNIPSPNPAFILKHPTKPVAYASAECIKSDGTVSTLKVAEDGTLTNISTHGAGGKSTCYLTLMPGGKHLLAVNYWDAKLALLPLDAEGVITGEPTQVIMQPGAEYCEKTNPDRVEHWAHRQRWPHTHCCVTEPYSKEFHFVTDLGTDSLLAYRYVEAKGEVVLAAKFKLRPQHGPRHIIFHPTLKMAYIVNELISSVSVLSIGDLSKLEGDEVFEQATTDKDALIEDVGLISTLPEGIANEGTWHEGGVWKADSHCSEIRIDTTGRFVYIGNRGHDSIAVFAVDQATGKLERTACCPSGGEFPRNFNFSACGQFMVVGNQRSNSVCVFAINQGDGTLDLKSQVAVPSPNFVFSTSAN